MGRYLKRVALDFNHPLNVTWQGYINPYPSIECDDCEGTGESPRARELSEKWYDWNGAKERTIQGGTRSKNAWMYNLTEEDIKVLLAKRRLTDFTRIPRSEADHQVVAAQLAKGGSPYLPYDTDYVPTPEEVNAWAKTGMGHDAINRWVCIAARCEKEGVASECETCQGKAYVWSDPETEAKSKAWKKIEPPAGLGYQLWQDTSEDSPQSPVFATLEELAVYAAEHATVFGRTKATKEEWLKMLEEDFIRSEQGNLTFI